MRYAQYFGSYGGRRYFRGAGRRQRRHRRREYLRPAADGLSGNGLHDRYRLLGGGFDPLVAVEDPGGPPERHAGDGVRDGGDLAAVFGDSAFPRPDGCVAGGFGASAAVGEGLFVVVYSGIGFPDVDGRRTFRYPFGRGAETGDVVQCYLGVAQRVAGLVVYFPLGWGVMGAAFATAISVSVGGGIALWYLLCRARSLSLCPLKGSRKSLRLSLRNVGYQCRIGSSALLGEATLATLMFTGNQVFMRYLGDDGVGAFGIACYYIPFVFMVGNAIAQSAQPIISYNFGAGASGRVIQARRIALATAVVCGMIAMGLFVCCPRILVGFFLDTDTPAALIAIEGFPLFASGFVFFIVNLTVIGYYQSLERVRAATTFALLRGFVLLVPAFLLLPRVAGISGIWLAMPLSELLTCAVIAVFYNLRRGFGLRFS